MAFRNIFFEYPQILWFIMIFRWLKWQLPFGYNIFFYPPVFLFPFTQMGKRQQKSHGSGWGKPWKKKELK